MSFTSELVQAGVKHISKKAAKFFNQMPVDDIAGTVRAVNRHPNEFADMMKHVNNYADKGDQSGILPYVQYQNKWKNEGVEDLRNSQTLTHGVNKGSTNQKKLYPWVGDRKTSELSQAGMRKNMQEYGYAQRKTDPEIPPAEMTEGFKEEMGTTAFRGEEQKFVSGGSKPTKTGQRRLQIQGVTQNNARRNKNIKSRAEHKSDPAYNKLKKEAAVENKQAVKDAKAQGIKITKGQQFVSVEHDIALSHGKKYWSRVGKIGNNPENLFIQRDQLARQFKDNIENWFYPKSDDFVIKSDRSNLKDLIIINAETGEEVLTIPMPDDFKTGIPDNILQQLNQLLGK